MSKWKLNRIKINGFKALYALDESYSSDLIVYDGPNGFGKTSLFDAKQVLFTGKLPRISAKMSSIKYGSSKPKQSLYRHHSYEGDVAIIAEFINGEDVLVVARKADDSEHGIGRRPDDLSHFKLYHEISFDNPQYHTPVPNEQAFWHNHFGANFLKNYSVLHYLPQDSSPLLLPDGSVDNKSRTNQIEHLFNLQELQQKQARLTSLLSIVKRKNENWQNEKSKLQEELNSLTAKVEGSEESVEHEPIFDFNEAPFWDNKMPFSKPDLDIYQNAIKELDYLPQLIEHSDEIEKRLQNEKVKNFVAQENFKLAVVLGSHLDKQTLFEQKKQNIQTLNVQLAAVKKPLDELKQQQQDTIESFSADLFKTVKPLFTERKALVDQQKSKSDKLVLLVSAREKLIELTDEETSECPLCGFDYAQDESKELLEAVNLRTELLQTQLDEQQTKLADCNSKITTELKKIKTEIEQQLELQNIDYDSNLLKELERERDKIESLREIVSRLHKRKITLPIEYSTDKAVRNTQIDQVKNTLLAQLPQQSDKLDGVAYVFFTTRIKTLELLNKITEQAINNKKQYLRVCFNNLVDKTQQEKRAKLTKLAAQLKACTGLNTQLKDVEKELNTTRNEYINKTVGQIESLFHIYSGRLLQNYQCGLGVFIEMPATTQKNSTMRFITPKLNKHDATISMSSGQTSAVSLALFLALNKRYGEAKFVFIDDPTQCMDEINIASLSDLLRVEMRDRQVVVSTHEPDIASYLTYRYEKAGLDFSCVNLLNRALEQAQSDSSDAPKH